MVHLTVEWKVAGSVVVLAGESVARKVAGLVEFSVELTVTNSTELKGKQKVVWKVDGLVALTVAWTAGWMERT
jgi:hypothetical protein